MDYFLLSLFLLGFIAGGIINLVRAHRDYVLVRDIARRIGG